MKPNKILSHKGTIISGLTDEEKSGSQPLQQTKGLRIKFADNKRKKAIKEKDKKAIRNKQKAIRAGSLLW